MNSDNIYCLAIIKRDNEEDKEIVKCDIKTSYDLTKKGGFKKTCSG